jgi:adenylate cyclase
MPKQWLTACCADIAGSRAATRHMPLERLAEFLQGFYERVGEILLSHNGRLLKYIGDAFIATFDRGQEEIAIRAMWALRERYRQFSLQTAPEAGMPSLNVGVASGEVIGGQIGHPQMLTYDIFGSPVSIASVLTHCRGLVIDDTTYRAVSERVVSEPVQTSGPVNGYRVTGLR